MPDTAIPTSIHLDAHLAKAGPAAESFARVWKALWHQHYIAPELLELCRLTLARLHNDAAEIATINTFVAANAISPNRRKSVLADTALTDPAFSAAEKAVLLFTESYWIDTKSITDEVADDVKTHFGEAALVFLIEALGFLDGRIRTARCLRDLSAVSVKQETPHVH